MNDGDTVYTIGGTETKKHWVQGCVVAFEDALVILFRNEKGVIQITDALDNWSLTKEEAVAKLRRRLKDIHYSKLVALEALDT